MNIAQFNAIFPNAKEIKTAKINKMANYNRTITLYDNGYFKRDWINQNDEGYISDSPSEQWMYNHIFN